MRRVNPILPIICVQTVQAAILGFLAHWALRWPLTGPFALGLFLTPALCLYFLFVFVAPWSWGLPILTRLPAGRKTVALTFDDGPSLETTPVVLDILRSFGATATFFVLGAAAERSPGLLGRISAEGHALAVHGYDHRPFVLFSPRQIQKELRRAREAVGMACPQATLSPWLRFPYGFKSLIAVLIARREGWRLVAWDVDPRDYRERRPEQVVRHVLDRVRPGSVVLLHDGPANQVTSAALPLILQGLVEAGYQFIKLPQS